MAGLSFVPPERGKGKSSSVVPMLKISAYTCPLCLAWSQSHEIRFTAGDLGNRSGGLLNLREEGIQVKVDQPSFTGTLIGISSSVKFDNMTSKVKAPYSNDMGYDCLAVKAWSQKAWVQSQAHHWLARWYWAKYLTSPFSSSEKWG